MKFMSIFIFIISFNLLGLEIGEKTWYKAKRKFPIKRGNSIFEVAEFKDDKVRGKIDYNVQFKVGFATYTKKGPENKWVPKKQFEHAYYEKIKNEGVVEEEDFIATFIGIEDVDTHMGRFYGCYKIKIVGKDKVFSRIIPWVNNNKEYKWEGFVWYHPDITANHWAKIDGKIKDVEIVGDIQVIALLENYFPR